MIVFLIMLAFSANGGLILVSSDESYNCDFNSGFCSWRQPSNDDCDWSIRFPPPPPPGGQPGERFAYIETSSRAKNDKGRLVSGIIWPTYEARLNVKFHMYENSLNTLRVYLQHICEKETQTLIFETTEQHLDDDWISFQEVFESSTPFIIVIEGVVGSSDHDIAIDDIVFKSVSPVTTTQTVTTTQLTTITSDTETSPTTTTAPTSSPGTTTEQTSSPGTTTAPKSSQGTTTEQTSSPGTTNEQTSSPGTTAPKSSPRTTTAPKSSETVDMSMIIVEDTPQKLKEQSENLSVIVFAALKEIFSHLPGFLRINLYSVGSLHTTIVHFGVAIDRGVTTAEISLLLAVEKVAKNEKITVGNAHHRIRDFQLKSTSEKGASLSATSDVCVVREAIFPCDSGHVCDIIDYLPICVQQKQCDRHIVIALSVSIPIGIISVFSVLMIFYTRKGKERTLIKSPSRHNGDDRLSSITKSTRYSSWHKSMYNNPTYFYDEASSNANELEKNRHLNNQRNGNDRVSLYGQNRFSRSSRNGKITY